MRLSTLVALTLSLAASAVSAGDVSTGAGAGSLASANNRAAFARSHQHMRMHRQVIKRNAGAASNPSPLAVARQTQDQLDAAAKLKADDDEFHRKNAEWQAAVMEDLKAGKTPLDFAAYWAGKGGAGAGAKSDAAAPTAPQDDAEEDDGDDDDEDDDGEDDEDEDDDDDDDDEDVTGSTSAALQISSTQVTPIASTAGTKGTKPTGVAPPASKGVKKPGHGKGNGHGNGNSGSDSGSGSGDLLSGDGTWYNMAGGYTACGQKYSDSDMVAALSWEMFDTKTPNGNPNNNGFCGKKLRATYQGKSVVVTAVDRCAGCQYPDVDFTPAAFSQLADVGVGRLHGVEWEWL
ncbi:hypothetical protein OC842_007102 [Tilletia horrida]|uniref:RlpA-like protein double-psi beta-barrel domain-containing protein n=1 Tax=Tilletia horrida TaxID=155126 RepID=A0AAN6G904_9BASI|nr:hypothetical protein OC842_007102 [Tilletia horrida]